MNLVIVESPTKARTLSKFLGKGYRIEATMGHIRDLPKDRLGVNINRDFEPYYLVPKEKKKVVERLRKIAYSLQHAPLRGTTANGQKAVSRSEPDVTSGERAVSRKLKIILATDLDREGEAIAWHVREILNNRNKRNKTYRMHRIVFHEITRSAIKEALKNPRGIDMDLVSAQQGRRILDRLVGYKLSPLLWYKTGKNWLSAGRVQSVAVRLICEREREIEAFKPEEYWVIDVELEKRGSLGQKPLGSLLPNGARPQLGKTLKNNSSLAREKTARSSKILSKTGGSGLFKHSAQAAFASFTARLMKIGEEKVEVKNKEEAGKIVSFLKKANYQVEKMEKRRRRRTPPAPFITSTMQRTAANFFGWSARKTMTLAQNLYEQGLITYHRTDSVQLSKEAWKMAREYINKIYGKDYLPEKPRIYKTKSKLAQEAHEAIRPTKLPVGGSVPQVSQRVSPLQGLTLKLGKDHRKLFDLISKRFVACQMREEEVELTKVKIIALPEVSYPGHSRGVLEARGERVVFEGWRIVFAQANTQIKNEKLKIKNEEKILPPLSEEELLNLVRVLPQQKFTQPPPRYNEASLIKTLEEKGIGRPSTYAPIISTIQQRHYVEKSKRRFKPTELGLAVNDFLVKSFPEIINVSFSAKMEDELDEIAQGRREWVGVVRKFWEPFEKKLLKVKSEKSKVKIEEEKVEEKCPECGGQLVVRIGRFGKFLACSNFPKCRFTKPIVVKLDIKCPDCGKAVVLKKTKKGRRFYGCSNYPKCKFASWQKPG